MFNLIPYLSVIENVTLPLSFAQRRLDKIKQQGATAEQETKRLLKHLGLTDPALLQRKVTELVVSNSGSQRRALIGSPELIIADEPTSALDTDSREAFIRLLFTSASRWQHAGLSATTQRWNTCLIDRLPLTRSTEPVRRAKKTRRVISHDFATGT